MDKQNKINNISDIKQKYRNSETFYSVCRVVIISSIVVPIIVILYDYKTGGSGYALMIIPVVFLFITLPALIAYGLVYLFKKNAK